MSFLNPTLFFVGLGAVAIPILIHILMRRRRRPVRWAAMRFLLEAYKKQRRRAQLEQILLLIARCLIVALLGASLARPLAGGDNLIGQQSQTLYIAIDNSLTSAVRNNETGQTELEASKDRALALIESLDPARGDRVGLLTLGGPAEPLVVPASADLGSVAELIAELDSTDSRSDLPGAVQTLAEAIGPNAETGEPGETGPVSVAVLGGLRDGSVDLSEPLSALPETEAGPVRLIAARPAQTNATNFAVTAVEPLRELVLADRQGSTPVRVRLEATHPASATTASSSLRVSLQLVVAGQAAPLGEEDLVLAAGQRSGEASFNADIARALAALDITDTDLSVALVATLQGGGDSLDRDNTFRRVIELRPRLRVGLVGPQRFGGRPAIDEFEPADWIRLALSPLETTSRLVSELEIVTLTPTALDGPRLAGLDVVLLTEPQRVSDAGWTALGRFTDTGRALIVTPDAEASVQQWADKLARATGVELTAMPEPLMLDEPVTLSASPAVLDLNDRAATGPNALALLSAELSELLAPVHVFQMIELTPRADTAGLGAVFAGERPAIWTAPARAGGLVAVFAFAPDLSWTDLPAKPAMVPLFQELTRQGAGAAGAWRARTAGIDAPFPPAADTLVSAAGETRPLSGTPPRQAGLFAINDQRGATLTLAAINPDLRAARTDALEAETAAGYLRSLSSGSTDAGLSWLDEQGATASDLAAGATQEPWTKLLLYALLALAIVEIFLGRLASHAGLLAIPGFIKRRFDAVAGETEASA